MGQKVRPTGFRTGIMLDWQSRWYANKQDFAELLVEDFKLRRYIKRYYSEAGISRIKIERTREARGLGRERNGFGHWNSMENRSP
jgi:small subunit ribosomal protein S3